MDKREHVFRRVLESIMTAKDILIWSQYESETGDVLAKLEEAKEALVAAYKKEAE